MTCELAPTSVVQRLASAAFEASVESSVFETAVMTEIEASGAFEAYEVLQEIAAFEMETKAAGLATMSLLAHLVGNSTWVTEEVPVRQAS